MSFRWAATASSNVPAVQYFVNLLGQYDALTGPGRLLCPAALLLLPHLHFYPEV